MVTVIITSEDEGFVLVFLELPRFYKGFFFGINAFHKFGSRFIFRILWNQFTSDGKVKNFLLCQLDGLLQRLRFLVDLIYELQQTFNLRDNALLFH